MNGSISLLEDALNEPTLSSSLLGKERRLYATRDSPMYQRDATIVTRDGSNVQEVHLINAAALASPQQNAAYFADFKNSTIRRCSWPVMLALRRM
jgi:hypothetical protein